MLKKFYTTGAFALLSVSCVIAGGLSTNTAFNASYQRFFSQEANVDITSLYANPAGAAFLNKGWHFSLSSQSVIQKRIITTGFSSTLPAEYGGIELELLKFNPNYNEHMHKFEGVAKAPFVPTFDVSYNTGERWSINLHLGMVGGGGACEFSEGLGTFDGLFAGLLFEGALGMLQDEVQKAAYAYMQSAEFPAFQQAVMQQCIAAGITDPAIIQKQVENGLAMKGLEHVMANYKGFCDGYMKGSNYMYGLQIGTSYKALDNLSFYLGVRGVYNKSNYGGYVQDAEFSFDNGQTYHPLQVNSQSERDYVLSLNCNQEGFGIAPVVGLHWDINDKWSVAGKYEFKTRVRLKNKTRMNKITAALTTTVENNPAYPTMSQFADGATIPDDMPSLLAVGAQFRPTDKLKFGVSGHWIAEKNARKHNDIQKNHDDDTYELLASAEWRCCKWFSISGGWQGTQINMSDQTLNDLNYSISSNSIGAGLRIYVTPRANIDLGYMHTFYIDRNVTTNNWMNTGLVRYDVYSRKNNGFGVALNLNL